MNALWLAPLVSFVSTLVGALILLFLKKSPRPGNTSLILGLCAGLMLGATIFSLLLPALQMKVAVDVLPSGLEDALSLLFGAFLMTLLHNVTPHEHMIKGQESEVMHLSAHPGQSSLARTGILMAMAVALHNLPEGFALGIGASFPETAQGILYGIGIQNVPEGALVGMAIYELTHSRWRAVQAVMWSGIVEAGGAVAGAWAGAGGEVFLRVALLMAAGAMVYVISHEMIPESHRQGFENRATVGFMLGLAGMVLLY